MCGIAGKYNLYENKKVSIETLKKMITTVRHRGPDGAGVYTDGRIGLAHARLSIIDLSGGTQPMCNEDQTIWITFNGEIFNYIELKNDLLKKGHKFRTKSDTEVIVHLYEDLGADCLTLLNGQFAFAVWDRKKNELFMARDRLGIRPLFYTISGGAFYFASEIKSLFASGEIAREMEPSALDEIFTFWHTVTPKTAFKDIYEVPPGYCLTVKKGVLTKRQYWDLDFTNKSPVLDFEQSMEALRELLIDSTRLRLRADVPVGAYLSGGLDSSVITALIKNFTDTSLKTFSVAFEDKNYDESTFQKEMANALGTEHHEIQCTYGDIGENFPEAIWHIEKPILRTAPVPLFLLSALVSKSGFKVVLTGEGADELLGGYDIFKETKIREFCARQPTSTSRPQLLQKLYPYLPAFQKQSRAYREAFFNKNLTDLSDALFSHRPRWKTTSRNKVFFSDDLKASLNSSSIEDEFKMTLPEGFATWKSFARAQYIETKNLLPGYILSSQGDRVSMAHSLEGRFPFLDHRVVEFCAALPLHYKMKGLNEKYLLKESMKKFVPERIAKRTKQPYLSPDSKSFFRGGKAVDYVAEVLSESCIANFGYFNPASVRHLFNKCRKGGAIGFRDNMAFVGILSTQLLHKEFIEKFEATSLMDTDIKIVK